MPTGFTPNIATAHTIEAARTRRRSARYPGQVEDFLTQNKSTFATAGLGFRRLLRGTLAGTPLALLWYIASFAVDASFLSMTKMLTPLKWPGLLCSPLMLSPPGAVIVSLQAKDLPPGVQDFVRKVLHRRAQGNQESRDDTAVVDRPLSTGHDSPGAERRRSTPRT